MENLTMYRRRLIPNECILLDKDQILSTADGRLVTSWSAIHPKKNLHHGISCFFFAEGIKLSKFYREDNSLVYWYIDMISASLTDEKPDLSLPFSAPDESGPILLPTEAIAGNDASADASHCLVVTDLLADILIYPDGFVKVVDLGEIADALQHNLLDEKTARLALRLTDRTLEEIYRGDFKEKQRYLEDFEK